MNDPKDFILDPDELNSAILDLCEYDEREESCPTANASAGMQKEKRDGSGTPTGVVSGLTNGSA